jgi:hypothetical protein
MPRAAAIRGKGAECRAGLASPSLSAGRNAVRCSRAADPPRQPGLGRAPECAAVPTLAEIHPGLGVFGAKRCQKLEGFEPDLAQCRALSCPQAP